jgi:hypothetical protein
MVTSRRSTGSGQDFRRLYPIARHAIGVLVASMGVIGLMLVGISLVTVG